MPSLDDYPELVALAVLVLGVAAALGARTAIARLSRRHHQDGLPGGIVRTLAPVAFWATLVAAIALALSVLGIGQPSGFVEAMLQYLPRLIIAVLVASAGHLVGIALRATLERRARLPFLPPRGAYWLVAGPAVVVAAQQLGVEVSFVADLALVGFTVVLAALGLAFALGARRYVANLVARRELDAYPEGSRVRIDGIEGTVVDVRRTGLVLATPEGLATVPAARFAASVVVRLSDTAQ